MIKRMLTLLLAVCFLAAVPSGEALAKVPWPDDTGVLSEAGIVVDYDSGAVLYGQNIHDRKAPASITKLLTALVVAENADLEDKVEFSHAAVYDVEGGSGNKHNMEEGDVLSVEECLYLLLLRSSNQAANALAIAKWLQEQPEVTDVYYVGLPDHPGFKLQRCQATGNGSMISFKVKTAAIATQALGKLHLICFAESLGGVETLLTYPLAQTHAEMPPELLSRTGLDDRLLRLSVGIEDPGDIIADLAQALHG